MKMMKYTTTKKLLFKWQFSERPSADERDLRSCRAKVM